MAGGSAPTARVVRVLDALRLHAGEGLRYADLAQRAGVSQATCHAILGTLVESGYVLRDPASKAYSLGPAALGLGDAAARAFPDVRRTRDQLDALAAATGLRCSAAMVLDDAITVVAVAGAAGPDDPIRPGTSVPNVAPFGAIHVAWSAPHEIEQWIRRAPSSAFTPGQLRAVVDDHVGTRVAVAPYTPASARLREALTELAAEGVPDEVRTRTIDLLGAIDRPDYTADDLCGETLAVNTITAPVFDRHGAVAFAVAVHLADPALPLGRLAALRATLLDAVDRMTETIGGHVPVAPRVVPEPAPEPVPAGGLR